MPAREVAERCLSGFIVASVCVSVDDDVFYPSLLEGDLRVSHTLLDKYKQSSDLLSRREEKGKCLGKDKGAALAAATRS